MAKDSVTCLSCADIVHDEGSEAMQCDLCDQLAHIACVGVTKAAYKLAGRLKGFQWLCPKCLDERRSTKHQVLGLASELKVVQAEASKVPLLERTLKALQATVEKLSGVIDFITSDSSPASLPAPSHLVSLGIPESPNKFATLQHLGDSSGESEMTDKPTPQFKHCPPPTNSQTALDLPHSQASPNSPHPVVSTPSDHDLPAPHSTPSQTSNCPPGPQTPSHSNKLNHGNSLKQQLVVYLRNIPSQISTLEVVNRLTKEGINLERCVLTPALGDFWGTRKFVKVTCVSLDRCNSLDKALKSNPHLPWFLSLYPPRRPSRRPHDWSSPHAHYPINSHVPSSPSGQPFLSKRPSLMGPILPPLISSPPSPQATPNTHPPRDPKIPALMSLQLPPLPALSTFR